MKKYLKKVVLILISGLILNGCAKREEICGFKNIEEFFMFMKLKPHIEKQLQELVCANKMKGVRKIIEHYNERNVDL